MAKRSQKEGIQVSVVSGDRDLLQLADEHIKIRIPKTSRGGTEVHDYYPGGRETGVPGDARRVHRCESPDGGFLGQYSRRSVHR